MTTTESCIRPHVDSHKRKQDEILRCGGGTRSTQAKYPDLLGA